MCATTWVVVAEPVILEVELIEERFPLYDGREVRMPGADDELPPLRAWLSRDRYWAQDQHLDVIVEVNAGAVELEGSWLRLRFLDADRDIVAEWEMSDLPGPRFALYPELPEAWKESGGYGKVEVVLVEASEEEQAVVSLPLRVEVFEEPVPRAGRVAIVLPNENGVTARDVPVTVGVPFPRGILFGVDQVRLVDSNGEELAVQVLETGRWSKFGSLRWVLCDFVVDLEGGPRELFLEYGPEVERKTGPGMEVESRDGKFPVIEAGRIKLDGGLWFDAGGDGGFVRLLEEGALNGAFVEHENGIVYRLPDRDVYTVEEQGANKVVIVRSGWYEDENKARFCRYEIRYVVHRDSPLLQIFHTWIFTGDGSRDRIFDMGWQFPMTEGMAAAGFLTGFGGEGDWGMADFLLQHDHDAFDLVTDEETVLVAPGRAPGVARMEGDDVRLYFGARDFWRNYPSELEFADGSLWFHNWPRHGKPRPEPLVDEATPTLLKFAHTGEVLDFRLPEAYTEEPLDYRHSHGRYGSTIWRTGEPETVNAQGVSRTEEFWFYATSDDAAAEFLEAWETEKLRAVVDPNWVAMSEAFYEIWPLDPRNYPAFEERYQDRVSHYRIGRVENAGLYGMWLYGDHLWSWNLADLYRQLRKGHGGYGELSWMPYARSGDPELLKRRKASTRQLMDAYFRHYGEPEVARVATGRGDIDRLKPGFWSRGAVPWGGRGLRMLDYETQPHQWWDAWFLTGDHRARDFALEWTDLVKPALEATTYSGGNRGIETVQKAFIDTYQNTFDPWFIVYSHHLAQLHRDAWEQSFWQEYGRFWSTGDREYHRFTGSEAHGAYYVDLARESGSNRPGVLAYAWRVSGDEEFLRMARGRLEEFVRSGQGVGAGGRVDASSELPMILAALESVEAAPPALHRPFWQRLREYEVLEDGTHVFRTPEVAIYKEEGVEVPVHMVLIRLQTYQMEDDDRTYWLVGPDGEEFLRGDMSGIGTYDNTPGRHITIPADAPAGVYRLHFEFRSPHEESPGGYRNLRGLRFPVTPPGFKEVIVLDEDRMGPASVGATHGTPGYFFWIPEGVETIQIREISSRDGSAIYNPDGTLVWQKEGRGEATAELDVPSPHQGALWRIVGANFIMDPQIPPYYSIDEDRWFNPEKIQ